MHHGGGLPSQLQLSDLGEVAHAVSEIIADSLSKAGFSWGYVSAIDSQGRTIWIADAHRDDGKRFVEHADEKRTAFSKLESPLIRTRRNVGRDPTFFVDRVLELLARLLSR